MLDHRHLPLSPPSLSPPLSLGLRLGGDGEAGGREERWWSWGLRRGGDGEVGGREKRLWSWGLRQGTEKFVSRLAQED
ncbi:hypothetical protein IGI04_027880 [Brassica rapa subsp. trilocularis]|uniref:Uncharacterized protein n=1 Tax=Brassica rapa subsp. trilocularis TaxID=1813537 RepID=A0ABQ7L3Y5_BRACM|nr:hypothetical protein IGI04_027880 [Brassica rapa subsp. trilocularis]